MVDCRTEWCYSKSMSRIHFIVDNRVSYGTLCGRGADSVDYKRGVTCTKCRKMLGLKPLSVARKKQIETAWEKEQ